MFSLPPIITVVDDDESLRRALARLLEAFGFRVRVFESAHDLLETLPDTEPGCLLLDVCMPNVDGLALQEILARVGAHKPIVFMTALADVPSSVRAMKSGAVDYLLKPFTDEALLKAMRQ